MRAADHGDERAVARLKLINQAASGGYGNAPKDKADKKKAQSKSRPVSQGAGKVLTKEKGEKDGEGKEKGDCCIM